MLWWSRGNTPQWWYVSTQNRAPKKNQNKFQPRRGGIVLAAGHPLGLCWGAQPPPAVGFDALVEPLSARPMFPARALATTREGACAPPVHPPQTAIGSLRTATMAHGHQLGHCRGARPSRSWNGEHSRPRLSGSTPPSNPFPPARCFQRGRWKPHARARALPRSSTPN